MERRAEDGMDEPPHASNNNPRTGGDSDAQVVPTLRLSIAHHTSQQPSSSQVPARISAVAMFFLRLKDGSFREARPRINCWTTTTLRAFYEFARSSSRLPPVKAELTDVLLLDMKFNFFVDVSMDSLVQDGVVYQFRLLEEGAFRAPPECPRVIQAAMRASLGNARPEGEQDTSGEASGNDVEARSLTVQSDSGANKANVVENPQVTAASTVPVNTLSGSSVPTAFRKRKLDTTDGSFTTRVVGNDCPTFTDLLPLLLTPFGFSLPPDYVSQADNLPDDAGAATTTNVAGSKDRPTSTHDKPLSTTDARKEHIDGGLVAKAASTKHVKVKKACNGHAHASGPKQVSQMKKTSKPNGTTKGSQETHTMPENNALHATSGPSSSSSTQAGALPSFSDIADLIELK